jgi:hypothetical protein
MALKNFKNSPFMVLVFFLFVAISGVSLGFFSSYIVHQRWLGFISFGIALVGFIGVFFSYFSFLGSLVQSFIDGIKSIFKK